MNIFKQILKEECKRLNKIKIKFKEELENLPKGSIVFKNIKGKKYPYLQYRIKDKVESKYIKQEQFDKIQKCLEKRKKIEKSIKKIDIEQNKLKRCLKIYNKEIKK